MIKIAHRGNYKGKDSIRENTLDYIREALNNGYNVEIDVIMDDGIFRLGHDTPGEKIALHQMTSKNIWVHAKTFETYLSLVTTNVHTFFHDKDDFVFTSYGIKWANTGIMTNDGIMVMPEYSKIATDNINAGLVKPLGICSDNFDLFKL